MLCPPSSRRLCLSPIFHYQQPPSESFRETVQSLNSLQATAKLPGNTDGGRKLLQLSVKRVLEWISSQSSQENHRYCQMARYAVMRYLLHKRLILCIHLEMVLCFPSLQPSGCVAAMSVLYCFCVFRRTMADISFNQNTQYPSQS